jgi:hypothetical protein
MAQKQVGCLAWQAQRSPQPPSLPIAEVIFEPFPGELVQELLLAANVAPARDVHPDCSVEVFAFFADGKSTIDLALSSWGKPVGITQTESRPNQSRNDEIGGRLKVNLSGREGSMSACLF